ncbi:MAG: hypothetical protein IKN05_00025, partial [Clostridia bacterium]|nr:hypothetical protein [Clostridia bacterium]
MRALRIILVIVALVCFGVALSYPIRYRMKQNSNTATMEDLAALRRKVQQENGIVPVEGPAATAEETEAPEISLPGAEETSSVSADALPPSPEGKAEVSLPEAEEAEAPEISLPGAEETEAPEISLPGAEETSSVSADALPP